jgi:hypothetical protein
MAAYQPVVLACGSRWRKEQCVSFGTIRSILILLTHGANMKIVYKPFCAYKNYTLDGSG